MGTFDSMLQEVHLSEDVPVAEMLGAERDYYERVADQIPSERLHPAIRSVKESFKQ